jgi:hypothetical protein
MAVVDSVVCLDAVCDSISVAKRGTRATDGTSTQRAIDQDFSTRTRDLAKPATWFYPQ